MDTHQTETHETPHRRLWRLLVAERQDLGLIALYGAAVGLFSLAVPIAAQSIVNTVAFTSLVQPLVILSLLVFVVLGVSSFLRLIQTYLVEKLQQRLFVRFALDLSYRLPRVKHEAFDRNRGTQVATRFFEVLTIQKTLALLLLDGLGVVLQGTVGLILLAFYHPLLFAFDFFLLAAIAGVTILPARRAIATAIKESKAKYAVAGWLVEIARNPVVFKVFGPGHALRKGDQVTGEYLDARKKHFRSLVTQISWTLAVQTIVSALLLGLGGFLVIGEQLTLGQLVAAELVVTMVVSNFAKFGKYFESHYDLSAAIDKLGELLDLPLERERGTSFPATGEPMSVEIRDVTFGYHASGREVLSRMSLTAPPRARIGIHGTNGSGKSTLIDVVLGLRQPSQGSVAINGVDLRDLDLQDYRFHVGVVRAAGTFDGTLFDNVHLGRRHITSEQVREALRRVNLLDEISALPDGMQTPLSGNTSVLSDGQTQRLMIARAIVGGPSLLLLDEAFESIDPENKRALLQLIYGQDAPWTVIAATHDPSELELCQTVLRLGQGKMIA